jgi:AcrR family transcriptional regulator
MMSSKIAIHMPKARLPASIQSTTVPCTSIRSTLSREKIEIEALSLIEERGLEGFSTRKLGERLNCEAMSIYHHFPSKAHLQDALVDRTLSSLPIAPRDTPPAERIRKLAQAWRAMSRQAPKFYLWMALHRWNSATGVQFLAEVLDCFHAARLPPEQAARGFRVLGYYLLGATLEETSGYAQGPSAMDPLPEADVIRLYPRVADAGRFSNPDEFDTTFELGLSLLLRGLGIEDLQASIESS